MIHTCTILYQIKDIPKTNLSLSLSLSLSLYIYIYTHVCVCIYIYIYIHANIAANKNTTKGDREGPVRGRRRGPGGLARNQGSAIMMIQMLIMIVLVILLLLLLFVVVVVVVVFSRRRFGEPPLGHAGFAWGWKPSLRTRRCWTIAGPRLFFAQEHPPLKQKARPPQPHLKPHL